MLLQADREVANAYLADGAPSAVLVRDGRVASPLAVGADAIGGIVVRAVLPPLMKKGDTVPSLRLDGRISTVAGTGVAGLHGR